MLQHFLPLLIDLSILLNYLFYINSEKVLKEKQFLNPDGLQKRFPLFMTDNRFSYFGGGIEDDHIPFLRRGKHL